MGAEATPDERAEYVGARELHEFLDDAKDPSIWTKV